MAKIFDTIVVCPKCGSSNYHIESDTSFIGGDPGFHVCHNCGNSSKFFLEIKKTKVKSFKKEAKKNSGNKKEKHVKNKSLFTKTDIFVLILGVILLSIHVIAFVVLVGGYFTLKQIFKEKILKKK